MRRLLLHAALAAALLPLLLAPAQGAPAAQAPPEKLTFDRPQGPVAPPQVRGPQLALSIREAVSLALARNFDITIESYNPRIRENELIQREAVFDPALVAKGDSSKSKLETASGLFTGARPRVTSTQTVSAGFAQKILTGADLSLLFEGIREATNSRQNLFDPNYTTRLTFSLTQPLLKNFGFDVNEADIRVARANRDQSIQTYRARVIEVVDQVEQAYLDLVFSIENLEFRRKSLDLAKDLLRRNRIQVEVGTLAPIEILEAEATVAAREEEVIVAEREVRDREDALKKLLNVTDDLASWNIGIQPTDKPGYEPARLDEMSLTLNAMRKRADLENSRIEIEKRKIELNRARQNLLPQLDLTASAANNAVQDEVSRALDREFSNKGYFLSGGLSFRIPIGNRQARATFDKTQLELSQASTSFGELEQSIMEEVRRAVRRARTDEKRIDATRVARRLAEERLAAQEKKFSVGLSTSRDILEDQERLANALTNETRALVDYNKSRATLDRVTHSTLERFRIRMDDPRAVTPAKKP